MNKREKVIACIGHVKSGSIHKMCNTSQRYALNIISEYKSDEFIPKYNYEK
jgi:hypothetical protein